MDPGLVRRALVASVEDLIGAHGDILGRGVHERTLGPHLATLLRPCFPGFDVDCEYNLDIDDQSGRKRAYEAGVGAGALVTPDVIVHRRGMNGPENNILVIELKKHGARAPQCEHDRKKLCNCTAIDGRNHLAYLRGALVKIGVERRVGEYEIEWFAEGRPLRAGHSRD